MTLDRKREDRSDSKDRTISRRSLSSERTLDDTERSEKKKKKKEKEWINFTLIHLSVNDCELHHTARNHRNDFVEISHFEHIPAF